MAGTTLRNASDYFRTMSEQFQRLDHEAIDAYASMIYAAWRDRRSVYLFGNGGSAYTASHHATDYVKTAAVDGQPRLRALSIVDNTGLTTALGNDAGYEQTLVYPLASYAQAGDLAVAISCSGSSVNVVRACQWAKDHDVTLIALTGFSGGDIGPMADLHINIPSDNYGVIEDIQMSIGHIAAQRLHTMVAAAREATP